MAERKYTITLTFCDGDFEISMGRTPRDDEEFEEWAYLLERDLLDGHLDILFECAREAMAVDANPSILGSSADRRKNTKPKPLEDAP